MHKLSITIDHQFISRSKKIKILTTKELLIKLKNNFHLHLHTLQDIVCSQCNTGIEKYFPPLFDLFLQIDKEHSFQKKYFVKCGEAMK